MANFIPLKRGATGLEEFGTTDTVPVGNLSDITSAKVTDFTEAAQDAVGGALTDSTTIDFTYNDGANTITAAVIVQMSITSDASGVKLSGDSASPGNSKYYGTDGSGTRGFYDLPTGVGETYTAGEAISARDLVYVSASGTVMKADANAVAKRAVGFAPSAISNGASGTIIFHNGKISGFTGLTAGSMYYLSNTTTGGIALYSALTYGSNDIQQFVGTAESTTVLRFEAGPSILIA